MGLREHGAWARARCATVGVAASLALAANAAPPAAPVTVVTSLPGLVAFWDFVKREPDGARPFTAHVPPGSPCDYALDAGNYVREFWGVGRRGRRR